ncbi:MAG: IPTL-CTERM sorting domain-containing protein [Candidatus Dadabacteria bacterium]|nr:IPTL-CTERM sorting domain-containing protein [Candidatus Dadabacteria bacterium]
MNKNYILLILISLLVLSPKLYAQILPATCDVLVTDIDMWGDPARGVDLRAYTNSTLHWIGCPTDGCAPDDFFCDFDPNTETLSFGTTVDSALRAAVDPGNAEGDTMPNENTSENTVCDGCCCEQIPLFGVCNAPNADNNGVPIDAADALCFALGYESGSLTEVDSNSCPEANAITADGSDWTSDFVESAGYGETYTCVGFRHVPSNVIPTLSEWGLITMAGVLGIIGFIAIRRRKVTA